MKFQANVPFKLTKLFYEKLGEQPKNKRILVIRDFFTAMHAAIDNSVTFITDDKEAYELFCKNIVSNDEFGNDDTTLYVDTEINKNAWKDFIKEVASMPKFDVAIMNPPYDKNLHLKILEAVIPIADKVVNISPVRWLQDPLAKYKKNSDYKKFEESISKKIESLDVIDSNTASVLFNAAFNMNLGIYVIGSGGYDYKSCENNIIDRILSSMPDNMCNHLQMSIPNNWSLVMSMMVGGSGGRLATCSSWNSEYDKYVYHDNTNNNGQTYEEYRRSKCWGNVKPRAEACHFEFVTEDELRNFYDALQTKFFRYIFTVSLVDVHVHPEFYPYMQDYTQPWTDKRFCEYFGITGYISDTEAEPDSEWELILNTMKEYV